MLMNRNIVDSKTTLPHPPSQFALFSLYSEFARARPGADPSSCRGWIFLARSLTKPLPNRAFGSYTVSPQGPIPRHEAPGGPGDMAAITAEQAGGDALVRFLNLIAFAEGTSTSPYTQNDGYDVIVNGMDGHHEFTDYSEHPFAVGRPGIVFTRNG